ncbi:hybrid sensor histidine kinase/response regulator transcription factor [Bacteroides sp.]
MKNQNHIYLYCLIICLFLNPYELIASHYSYKQLSLKDGLPSTVRCAYAEKTGFVWIGTQSGLGRFDGHELKRYTHQDDNPNSLPHNYIHQILEDSLHNIWILTDKGIARYRRKSDDFDVIKNENGQNILVSASCKIEQGVLFCTRDNKLYRYNYGDDTFTLLFNFRPEPPFLVSSAYMWDSETLLCCSRWQGMLLVNLRTGKRTPPPFNAGSEIRDMIMDSQKRIWVAPYNSGILCFSQTGHLLASYTTRNSELSSDLVLCMAERDSQIWIGTDGGGINILNPENGEISVLEHIPGNNYSLPVNSILYLHNDKNNNMWAGTVRGGLINICEISMKTYTDVLPGNDGGLSEATVLCLFQDSLSEDIWIGTDGGGLNKLEPQSGKFTHYPSTWGNKVASVTNFSSNDLLLSFFSKDLFLFDKRNGRLKPFHIDNEEIRNQIRYSGKALNVYQDSPGSVLLLGRHVYRYDIASGEVNSIEEEDEVFGTVLPISHTSKATYFFDSRRIYVLDHSIDKLKTVFAFGKDTLISSVSRDGQGIFWIGSNRGFGYYNPTTDKYHKLPTSFFDEVNLVICDQRGKVWLGTDKMLFAWLVNEKKFIMFGESDGAIMNEYLNKPRIISVDGDIYMGGVKGLLRIDKNQPVENYEYPKMQLTDVFINGEPANDRLSDNPAGISVPWNNQTVVVRIMSAEKDIFRQKVYRYQIVGFNNQYIDSYSPELVIRSLPPGTYEIMASCSTRDGDWTPLQQVLEVTVLPPWYQTWWFILICVIIVSGIIIQTFLMTLRRKENKLKWAMKEHEQQVYEEKVRFLINISHELRTPLTLIYAPLNRLLKTLSETDVNYAPLKGVFKQAKRMKDLLNMVLEVRKMEVGVSKLQIHPESLNNWIQDISQDFAGEAQGQNVCIRCQLDERITEVGFDKEKCEIILTNLLINALKHSPEGSEIQIRSELLPDQQRVRVSVIDQGDGLKQVDISKLFTRFYQGNGEQGGSGIGLSYSRILAELHGGTIGAKDNETVGATFFFELPLRLVSEEVICQPKAYLNELIVDEGGIADTSDTGLFPMNQFSLLLVDDNQELIDFMGSALRERFKEVYTAKDGVEALEMAKKYQPDIVVSDVMMPRMNGYELCKHIKEDIDISHIPVILLTARDDEQSQLQGYKNGADAYLTKPFEEDMLFELIKNRLKNREQIKSRYLHAGVPLKPEETTFSRADETFLLKLNKVITERLDDATLDIPFICKEVGMSRATLYSKLKAITGMGANDYINKLRLEKAIVLVTKTDLTFIEIAERTGFSSSRYFSTAFKQYTGETPTQYRESRLEQENSDK